MTGEEFNLLFHRAEVNRVAFVQVYECYPELHAMVEMALKKEREAILNILWDYAGRKDLSDSDESLLKHLVDLIRARGET